MSKKEKRLYYTTMDSVYAPELNHNALRRNSRVYLPTDTPFSEYGGDFCGLGRIENKLQTYKLEDYFSLIRNKHIR